MSNMDIYFATSTYQTILSTAIALDKDIDSTLIVEPSYSDYERVLHCLRKIPQQPFRDILITYPHNPRLRLKKRIYNSLSVLRTYFFSVGNVFRDVYTTHTTPTAQVLLDKAKRDRIYLEDGTALYSPISEAASQTAIKYILSKIFYTPHWDGEYAMGTHPVLNKLTATHPDFVHENFSGLTKQEITAVSLHPVLKSWSKNYLKCLNVHHKARNLDSVLLLPHSESISNKKKRVQFINSFLKMNTDPNCSLGVKYHPRESEKYFRSRRDVIKIPQTVPAEFLYADNLNITTVIGGQTTALLSAKWIDSSLDVMSYLNSEDFIDSNLYALYSTAGIELINS